MSWNRENRMMWTGRLIGTFVGEYCQEEEDNAGIVSENLLLIPGGS